MSEGTVALTPDNAIAFFHSAQKELREAYALIEDLRADLRVTQKLYKESCDAAYDRGDDILRIQELEQVVRRWVEDPALEDARRLLASSRDRQGES